MSRKPDGHDQLWLGGTGTEALLAVSQGVKKRAYKVLEKIEQDPVTFPVLDDVPLDMSPYPGVAVRKARVAQGKHDYRIIFLHRLLEDGSEHVDLLYVIKRKDGYRIDWEWIKSVLGC